jgi:hypothetical protein
MDSVNAGLVYIAALLLPFAVISWGLVGLWLGYYQVGDRVLRGNDARVQNLKIIALGFALTAISWLPVLYLVRSA